MSIFGDLTSPEGDLPIAGQTRSGSIFGNLVEEPENDTGPFGSLLAGTARGALEPLGIFPPINEINERLKSYAGNSTASKIGYGLGFFGGMLIPGSLAWKVGSRVAKVAGYGEDVVKAAKLIQADNAAELMRRATLIRGAVGGALWGAGRNADDPQEYVQHIMTDAVLGGVGDVAQRSIGAALAARWGKKIGKNVENAVDHQLADDMIEGYDPTMREAVRPEYAGGAIVTPAPKEMSEDAAYAYGQAMQVIHDLTQPPVRTVVPPTSGIFPKPFGMNYEADSFAARRLNLTMGLESLPWADMRPGTLHIVPAPHGDASDLVNIINSTDALWGKRMKWGEHQSVLVGLRKKVTPSTDNITQVNEKVTKLEADYEKVNRIRIGQALDPTTPMDSLNNLTLERDAILRELNVAKSQQLQAQKRFEDFSEQLVKQYDEFGLVRGQNVQYRKADWIVLRPAKGGAMLTQAGRVKRAVYAKYDEILPLSVVDDLSQPESITNLAETAAAFVSEHGLWPGAEPTRSVGGLPIGFEEAFNTFTKSRNIVGKDRIKLQSYMADMQRKAIIAEAPEMEHVFNSLSKQAEAIRKKPPVEGDLISMVQDRGLTVVKTIGPKHQRLYSFIDENGKKVGDKLTKRNALQVVRAYGVPARNMTPELPIADGVFPPTGGATGVAHTAGEFPGPSDKNRFNISASTTVTRSIYPRIKYFQDVQNQLIKQGNTTFAPFDIADKISHSNIRFRNELDAWTHGGKMSDGVEVKGWAKIFKRGAIRGSKREDVSDLIETPLAQWDALAKERGLNVREVQVARDTRDQLRKIWDRLVKDENIDIDADDFIENYLPHYLTKTDSEALKALRLSFRYNPNQLNEVAAKFASEMTRRGIIKKWERDPLTLVMSYTRAALYKSHMKNVINEAVQKVNLFPEGTGPGSAEYTLKRSLMDYISLQAYGTPEVLPDLEFAAREVFKTLGMKVPDVDATKLVNTFISMNYGAFMGFRPSLVLRNLSQTLMTTYPVLGGKYTAYGIRMAMRTDRADLMREAFEQGALIGAHKPLPAEDAILGAEELAHTGILGKTLKGMHWLNDKSLWAFQKADDLNRFIAYEGQKKKMMDAFVKHNGNFTDEFMRDSGLNYYGVSIKKQFKEMGFTDGELAGKWLGVHASRDTQWVYQLGAGPSMFSTGLGRIGGQYGTWGTWWAAYLTQGGKNLEGAARTTFIARNIASHLALVTAGSMAGFNAARWTGLSSLSWMGGPMVDWFYDLRNVWMGVLPSGEVTADRRKSLSGIGLEDDGSGPSMLPSVLGGRIGMRDPVKLATSFFGVFTPGALMLKDGRKMLGSAADGNWAEFTSKAIGMPVETAGYEWPWFSGGGDW